MRDLNPSGIKDSCLLFDMYNTLLWEPNGYEEVSKRIADFLSVDYGQYKQARLDNYEAAVTGAFASPEERMADTVSLLSMKVSSEDIKELSALEIAMKKEAIVIFEDAEETLATLKERGANLGLVSNATPEWANIFNSTRLNGYFDVCVFSCEAAAVKPEAKIYTIALEGLGGKPMGSWFIGDGADNELEGAFKLGMQTVRIERGDVSSRKKVRRSESPLPTWTIDDMRKLPELIELNSTVG